ncbi:MAG: hypothetical protein H7839_08955 [Magnetococcus sp. YQC-5]
MKTQTQQESRVLVEVLSSLGYKIENVMVGDEGQKQVKKAFVLDGLAIVVDPDNQERSFQIVASGCGRTLFGFAHPMMAIRTASALLGLAFWSKLKREDFSGDLAKRARDSIKAMLDNTSKDLRLIKQDVQYLQKLVGDS